MLTHTENSPVLILGHGRSGTSIFSRLLRENLHVSFGTESQFIVRFYHHLPSFGDLSQKQNLQLLIREILEERFFERCKIRFDFSTTAEEIEERVQEPTYRGVLDAIFLSLAEHLEFPPRWGDKTPEYTEHLDVMGKILPDAKMIHLVRDGRDVALSLMRLFWGRQNFVKSAQSWVQALTNVRAFLAAWPKEQQAEIRYEDLLTRPDEIFEQMVEFLAVEFESDEAHRQQRENWCGTLRRANYDKWRTAMTQSEQRRYERVAGEMLNHYGYECAQQEPARPLAWYEDCFWSAHSRMRQWCYLAYWKDTAYKLKLRLRRMTTRAPAS